MERMLCTEDHELYRHSIRDSLAREVAPYEDKWDDDRWIDREVFAKAQDGDQWILNGQKTFISSGIMADLIVVAARSNPDSGSRGSACS